jgi:hypothetical protein
MVVGINSAMARDAEPFLEESRSVPAMTAIPAAAEAPDSLSPGEVKKALEDVPRLLETATDVTTTSNTESAAINAAPEATVDVKRDAHRGVVLNFNDGDRLAVELPNSEDAGSGVKVADGTVAYAGENSANAVQAFEFGAARMLQVIGNRQAPLAFTYDLNLPAGSRIRRNQDRSLQVRTPDGSAFRDYIIAPAWARDAKSRVLPARYTTDGRSKITLHVAHRKSGVAYPVVADPFWIPAWVLWACGIGFLAGGAGYWVGGGSSLWRFLASGAVGCVFGIIGKKF